MELKIDKNIEKKAETLFSELGMSLDTAINIFIRQAIREGGIPFTINLNEFNQDSIEALLEAREIANNPNVKTYDLEDALKELKK